MRMKKLNQKMKELKVTYLFLFSGFLF